MLDFSAPLRPAPNLNELAPRAARAGPVDIASTQLTSSDLASRRLARTLNLALVCTGSVFHKVSGSSAHEQLLFFLL